MSIDSVTLGMLAKYVFVVCAYSSGTHPCVLLCCRHPVWRHAADPAQGVHAAGGAVPHDGQLWQPGGDTYVLDLAPVHVCLRARLIHRQLGTVAVHADGAPGMGAACATHPTTRCPTVHDQVCTGGYCDGGWGMAPGGCTAAAKGCLLSQSLRMFNNP